MQYCQAEFVGDSCGQHGPYTFFRSVKYRKEETWQTLRLGEFFHARIDDPASNQPISMVGELHLLWQDRNHDGVRLASVRFYFLPEDSDEGRNPKHGQDEVMTEDDKFVLRIEDLLSWVCGDPIGWAPPRGGSTDYCSDIGHDSMSTEQNRLVTESRSAINGHGVHEDMHRLTVINGEDKLGCRGSYRQQCPDVVILSYPQYCRYRAMLRRSEICADHSLVSSLLCSATGLPARQLLDRRIMYCKDTANNRALRQHSHRLGHLAPILKGRKRKKKVLSQKGRESEDSTESETITEKNLSDAGPATDAKPAMNDPKPKKLKLDNIVCIEPAEKGFLSELYKYMKDQNTPIGRIPSLGFKEVDLYQFYTCAQHFGGYSQVTEKRLWKHVYDQLGGCAGNTSAATGTRRNYEKLLLPYELHLTSANKNLLSHKKTKSSAKSKKPVFVSDKLEIEVGKQTLSRIIVRIKNLSKGQLKPSKIRAICKTLKTGTEKSNKSHSVKNKSTSIENYEIVSEIVESPISETTGDNENIVKLRKTKSVKRRIKAVKKEEVNKLETDKAIKLETEEANRLETGKSIKLETEANKLEAKEAFKLDTEKANKLETKKVMKLDIEENISLEAVEANRLEIKEEANNLQSKSNDKSQDDHYVDHVRDDIPCISDEIANKLKDAPHSQEIDICDFVPKQSLLSGSVKDHSRDNLTSTVYLDHISETENFDCQFESAPTASHFVDNLMSRVTDSSDTVAPLTPVDSCNTVRMSHIVSTKDHLDMFDAHLSSGRTMLVNNHREFATEAVLTSNKSDLCWLTDSPMSQPSSTVDTAPLSHTREVLKSLLCRSTLNYNSSTGSSSITSQKLMSGSQMVFDGSSPSLLYLDQETTLIPPFKEKKSLLRKGASSTATHCDNSSVVSSHVSFQSSILRNRFRMSTPFNVNKAVSKGSLNNNIAELLQKHSNIPKSFSISVNNLSNSRGYFTNPVDRNNRELSLSQSVGLSYVALGEHLHSTLDRTTDKSEVLMCPIKNNDQPTDMSMKTMRLLEEEQLKNEQKSVTAGFHNLFSSPFEPQDEPLNLSAKLSEKSLQTVRSNNCTSNLINNSLRCDKWETKADVSHISHLPIQSLSTASQSHLVPEASLGAPCSSGTDSVSRSSYYLAPQCDTATQRHSGDSQLARFLPRASFMPQFRSAFSSTLPRFPTREMLSDLSKPDVSALALPMILSMQFGNNFTAGTSNSLQQQLYSPHTGYQNH